MTIFPLLLERVLRSPSEGGTESTSPMHRGLDFGLPRDNVYAFGKLWGTYADEPVYSCFHGTMFASIEGRRLLPLFGYMGSGIMQVKELPSGHVKLRGKETGYFTDLASGQILDSWDNPFTGKRVEVFNFFNDRVRGELGFDMPVFSFGDAADAPTVMNEGTARNEDGRTPFVLPWQVYGDETLLEWDYTHCYTNPVDPTRYPEASTGARINPSEHFTFFTSLRELEDRSCPSAHFRAGFTRLSPFWPWMKMGKSGVSGVLFGRCFSRKCVRGLDDMPRVLRERVEREAPAYLEAPTDWDDGKPMGTWEAYARTMPPEV
jgi:hypothetical protein